MRGPTPSGIPPTLLALGISRARPGTGAEHDPCVVEKEETMLQRLVILAAVAVAGVLPGTAAAGRSGSAETTCCVGAAAPTGSSAGPAQTG